MSGEGLYRGAATFLLVYTAFLYLVSDSSGNLINFQNKHDWWIYGWLTGLSGILLLWNDPTCPYWRIQTAIAIVFGTIETLFLFWSIRHVEKAAIIGERNVLPEGRNIFLCGIATILTISSRIRSSHHSGLLDLTRTLILVTAFIVMIPVIGYSTCFYTSHLPYCHLLH